MTTFTVTTTADTIDPNDGKLSLREAVRQANATTAADNIVFATALEGRTLTLAQGELTLKQDVTIDGDRNNDGTEVTLSGGDVSRILQLSGDDTDVDLRDINLANGRVDGVANGAAILVTAGGLSLTNCTIRDSSCGPDSSGEGGGIFAGDSSRVTIQRSAIFDNDAGYSSAGGGGIATGGNATLVIRDSVLRGNSAGYYGNGGAVLVTGGSSLTMEDTAVVDNRGYDTGGIEIQSSTASITRSTLADNRAFFYAGGLLLSDSNVSISDSTFVANRGYAGAIYALDGSTLAMRNSTVTGNTSSGYYARTGGIWVTPESRLDLANSIVAGNAVDGPNAVGPDIAGAVTISNGHNIFGSDVDGAIVGDMQGIAPSLLFAAIDPTTGGGQVNADGIVPLRNNVSNPALSGGDPLAALPTDQIGHARPLPAGSLPDIGAAERNQALSTHDSPNNDVLTGTGAGETIAGHAGADLIRGLGGNDFLRGEGGSDLLDGGSGNDLLDGGEGINLVRYAGSVAVTIDLVAGTGVRGSETDTLSSIRGAIGSSSADTFTGDDGPNWFQGGDGQDIATGGAGHDLYDLDRVQDSLPGSANRDLILDFAPQSDRIDLTGIDADTTLSGNQAFRFVETDPLTGAGQLGFFVSGGNAIVRGSTDTDAAPEFQIQLTGLTGIGGYVFYL